MILGMTAFRSLDSPQIYFGTNCGLKLLLEISYKRSIRKINPAQLQVMIAQPNHQ